MDDMPGADDNALHSEADDLGFAASGRPPRLELAGSVNRCSDAHFVVNNEKDQLIHDDLVAEGNQEDTPTLTTREMSRGLASGSYSYSASGPYHCHVIRAHDSKKATRQLITVSCLCTLFLAAELTGGLLSNSLALVTDATHMASDLFSFLVGLFAIWMAKKPATERMSFGFYRAEVMGALISVLLIWLTTAVLLYLAVGRIIHDDYEINADDMLITAGLGVAFNIIMMVILNSGSINVKPSFGHNHSHGGHNHSHGDTPPSHSGHVQVGHGHNNDIPPSSHTTSPHTQSSTTQPGEHRNSLHDNIEEGGSNGSVTPEISIVTCDTAQHRDSFILKRRRTSSSGDRHGNRRTKHAESQNINVRAAFIHAIGDFIQSIGVLIAAYIIKYKPEYKIVDPICTFLFSILVLCTTLAILRDALSVIMEGVPKRFQYKEVKRDLRLLEGVHAVHSLHVWALTIDKVALAVHIAVASSADRDIVLRDATSMLRERYNVHSSTIQVEAYEEDLMTSCEQCTGPTASVGQAV